jgi:hypothetical protein
MKTSSSTRHYPVPLNRFTIVPFPSILPISTSLNHLRSFNVVSRSQGPVRFVATVEPESTARWSVEHARNTASNFLVLDNQPKLSGDYALQLLVG